VFLFFALTCLLSCGVSSLPNDLKESDLEGVASKDENRRATWLETRDLEDNFEQLTLLSLRELINKGYVKADVLLDKAEEKRGRHQGFCFKKTKSGKYLPYICWKDQDE